MTHMHGDHAGGIPNFPNSYFLLSETERHAIQAKDAVFNGYLTMHYPTWFKPNPIRFNDGAFESFESSHKLTQDGKIRLVPTTGHTLGHQAVIVDMGDYYIFIGGDASYSEDYLLNGDIDGVCIDGKLHRETTARIRELCQRKPTITQFAHDFNSELRLLNKQFTQVKK